MNFNLKDYKNDLLFIPLGGSGEIGMNLNLYYYEGKWLVVDFGSGFPEEYLPGIDVIVPDISFIAKHKADVAGIILTHSHEDHIGAIQYLWHELDCPIYAPPFTAKFLRHKLQDNHYELPNTIHELNLSKNNVKIGPYNIDMVSLCHSAPEMTALILKTKHGNIFHTGDWKFDDNPVVGEANNEEVLAQYGKDGILAVIGDSTNVFNQNHSGSEGDLQESLTKLVSHAKNLVVVTTFASNLGRLQALFDVARDNNRKVILAGRSLRSVYKVAKDCGYLKGVSVLEDKDIKKYPRNEILIVATGCQGEPMAAVTKIVTNTHPTIRIVPGDTVIFSSKIIPGNEKKIYRIFNKLIKLGIKTLTENTDFVHVSGHPSQKELKRLYDLLKPQVVIPVHGEHVHMHEHGRLAKTWGVPHSLFIENGDVVKLSGKTPQKVAKVEARELAVYGNYLLGADSAVMKMRRRMKMDGIFVAVVVISNNGLVQTDPIILTPGYLDESAEKHLMIHIQDEIRLLVESRPKGQKMQMQHYIDETDKNIKVLIRRILKEEVQKIPEIRVVIRVI